MATKGADGQETPSLVADGGRQDDYLLCIDGERSWRVPVPLGAELLVGRGPDAAVRLNDALVSRHHLRCMATPDGLRLVDLGSRHGTLVNGERIAGARLVRSGDVVTVGNAALVLHRVARGAPSAAVDREALVRRLEDELVRARHYGREVAVVVARSEAPIDAAAIALAAGTWLPPAAAIAALGPQRVAAVAPELDAAAAAALGRRLADALGALGVAVAVGVAVAPADAIVADALLGAARGAADAAAPGEVRAAGDGVPTLDAGPHRIVVADPAMAKLYELAARLARSALPILIEGETGVGKEVAAAAIHAFSKRAGAFVAVNCAAVPEALAESEWFGHARGAFTGASAARAGYLELASGGTLFLDELGELSLPLQAKLLRALEVGEVVRLGETTPRPVQLRVVAATNRDLGAEVEAGRFRRDLFFRVGAARLVLPPLRDRPRDLAVLCRRLLDEACAALGRGPLALSVPAIYAMLGHAWPGNVRELRNVVGYLAAASLDSASRIELEQVPLAVTASTGPRSPAPAPRVAAVAPAAMPDAGARSVADDVRALERGRMVGALRATSGQINRAAALIEMPLRTFATKLKRYAITAADWREPPA